MMRLQFGWLFLVGILVSGCAAVTPQEPPPFEAESIRLEAAPHEVQEFRSARFPVMAGHHEVTVRLRAVGLSLSSSRTLRDALRIRLRLFDESGAEINQHVIFRKIDVDTAELGAAFEGIDSDAILEQVGESTVHLMARYYPLDSGWIPPAARTAEFEMTFTGPGSVLLSGLEIHRSKWNIPLRERVERYGESEVVRSSSPALTAIRAANSQGTPATQYEYLSRELSRLPAGTINSVCIEGGPGDVVNGKLVPELAKLVELLRRQTEEDPGFTFGISYNPYWTDRESWDEGKIELGSPETMERLRRTLRPLFALGASYLLLRTDDLVPRDPKRRASYFLDHPRDVKRFGSLGHAHGYLVTETKKFLESEARDVALYFVPPWYGNVFIDDAPELSRKYFRELAPLMPEGVPFVWTGPSVRSLVIDTLPTARFEAITDRPDALLWDNTLYARRHRDLWLNKSGRIRFGSFIEPYETVIFPEYFGPQQPFVFINGDFSPIGTIQYVTAGRYFADPKHYVPERALWEYLLVRFGETGAKQLLRVDGALISFLDARASRDPGAIERARRDTEAQLQDLKAILPGDPIVKQFSEIAAQEFSQPIP